MMIIDYVFLGLYSDLVVPLSLSLRTVRKGGEVGTEYAIRVSAKIWSKNGSGGALLKDSYQNSCNVVDSSKYDS